MNSNRGISHYSQANNLTSNDNYLLNKQTSLKELITYDDSHYTSGLALFVTVIRAKKYFVTKSNEKAKSFQHAKTIFDDIHKKQTNLVKRIKFSKIQQQPLKIIKKTKLLNG